MFCVLTKYLNIFYVFTASVIVGFYSTNPQFVLNIFLLAYGTSRPGPALARAGPIGSPFARPHSITCAELFVGHCCS